MSRPLSLISVPRAKVFLPELKFCRVAIETKKKVGRFLLREIPPRCVGDLFGSLKLQPVELLRPCSGPQISEEGQNRGEIGVGCLGLMGAKSSSRRGELAGGDSDVLPRNLG